MPRFSPIIRLDLIAAVAADTDLCPSALCVYTQLAKRCSNQTGQAFPSLATLAESLNITKRTVVRAIQALASRHWLKITRRLTKAGDHTSNVYTLVGLLERAKLIDLPPVDNPAPGDDSHDTTPTPR